MTPNQKLSPIQIRKLQQTALQRGLTIDQLLQSRHKAQQEFQASMEGIYEIADHNQELALSQLKIVISTEYNENPDLQTSANKSWLHALYLELSNDVLSATNIFYPERLTEQQLSELAGKRADRAMAKAAKLQRQYLASEASKRKYLKSKNFELEVA